MYGQETQNLVECKLVMGPDFTNPSLEKYASVHRGCKHSQLAEKMPEQHIYWQEQEQGGHALRFTKQASKEKLNNMRKQLVMKFMLQLHKLPTCLDRKCGTCVAGDALENG